MKKFLQLPKVVTKNCLWIICPCFIVCLCGYFCVTDNHINKNEVKDILKKNIFHNKNSLDKINVNETDDGGNTLLHAACFDGRLDIVKKLIKKGALVNVNNFWYSTPLGYAVLRKHYNVVEFLLQHGADPNSIVSTDCGLKRTVLAEAITDDDTKMIGLLKKYGADLNKRGKKGLTDAHYGVFLGDKNFEKLLKAGLDPKILSDDETNGFFDLPSCNQVGNEEVDNLVKLLKKYGANIDQQKKGTHTTPLFQSIIEKNYCTAEILLKNGASPDVGGIWWMDSVTPLHYAAIIGDYEAVKLLLKYGASVEGTHYWNITPLSSAADMGKDCPEGVSKSGSPNDYLKIVKLLIKHGANVNNVEKYDNTPLYHAIEGGNNEIVKELLHSGAETNVINFDKETPVSLAKRLGKGEILKSLMHAQKH